MLPAVGWISPSTSTRSIIEEVLFPLQRDATQGESRLKNEEKSAAG